MGLWKTDRFDLKTILYEYHIQANNETVNLNLFQFAGSKQIHEIFAEIRQATAITNMTNVYFNVNDGTNTVNLTSPGVDLSGAVVQSIFGKMRDNTEIADFDDAADIGVLEYKGDEIVQPFIITAKYGVDNYIRLTFTTNTILNIVIGVLIKYKLVDGGFLIPV